MSDLSGLILDATTSLEVDLTGAVATNQLPFVVCYLVLNKSTLKPVDDGATTETGQTNNTTAVTMLAAPAANTKRVLKYLSLKNSDTAAVEPWIQINDNTTLREIIKPTLAVGDSIIFTPENGFYVVDSTGRLKTTGGVNGPGSSTDNAIARWNGTGGNAIQDSGWTLADTNVLTAGGNVSLGANYISRAGTAAGLSLDASNNATLSGNLTVNGAAQSLYSASLDNDFLLRIANTHATNGYGLQIRAGDDAAVLALSLENFAGTEVLFRVNGAGGIQFAASPTLTTTSGNLTITPAVVLSSTLTVNGAGGLTLSATASPTGTGAGAVGQIAWDTAYIYVCTATNDWRRVALTDF